MDVKPKEKRKEQIRSGNKMREWFTLAPTKVKAIIKAMNNIVKSQYTFQVK